MIRRRQYAALCGLIVLGVVETGLGAVDLEWRQEPGGAQVGDIIRVGLYAVADEGSTYSIAGIDAVISWDPAVLQMLEPDGDGAPDWMISRFQPDDPYGLNEVVPPQDGDAFYEASAWWMDFPIATPDGLLVTTFRFRVLSESCASTLSILPCGGSPMICSRVYHGDPPPLYVTGMLGVAAIVADGTPPDVTVPAPLVVACMTAIPEAAETVEAFLSLPGADASDNCTDVADLVVSSVMGPLVGDACDGILTRTYTLADEIGNTIEVDHVFTVRDDEPPQVSECPTDQSIEAAAGHCTVDMTWQPPIVTDNCDPEPTIEYAVDLNDDGEVDVTIADPAYTFSGGTHRVTVVATDDCDHTNDDCSFLVTVDADSNQLKVDIEVDSLDPLSLPMTRCITFELYACDGTSPEEVRADVTFDSPGPSGGVAAHDVIVPVPCGVYTCITARDELHTLSRTLDVSSGFFFVEEPYYIADFVGAEKPLVSGDLNGDGVIDIQDYVIYTFVYGEEYAMGKDTLCAGSWTYHGDLSGNGIVEGNPDVVPITTHFWWHAEPACCEPAASRKPTADAGESEAGRVSVERLIEQNLPGAARSDANRDGWVDSADIETWFRQGGWGPQGEWER